MELQIGSTVGDYQVVGILGAGGMGKVYKVRNLISDRMEAMKVLLPDLANAPELADRFLREIKVQASLEHPNIAALHTALRVENQLLMLMEFVEGMTLEQKLQEGPLPEDQAVDYAMQVLAALEYAHAHGVIHRDIKPANMILTPAGIVKLMDFGIAKAATDRRLTVTGTTMGSLYYMSPEQIQGTASLDARSDLYSVGVSLYELVTGKHPFDGDSQFAIMAAHLEKAPVPPMLLDPNLPQALNDAILISVAKDPNARFQTAGAFRNALGCVMPAPAPVAAPMAASQAETKTMPRAAENPPVMEQAPPARPPSRRGLWMALGAVAAVAAVVALIQFAPWKGSKAAQQNAVPSATQQTSTPASPVQPPSQPQAPAVQQPLAQQAPALQTPAAGAATSPSVPALISKPVRESPRGTSHPANAQTRAPLSTTTQAPAQVQAATESQPQAAVPGRTAPDSGQRMPPPQTASVEELQQLREQLAQLGARADAQRGTWGAMQRDLMAKGMNLNSARQEQLSLMNTYLNGASAALNDGNAAKARDFMGKAERQIEKLEQH